MTIAGRPLLVLALLASACSEEGAAAPAPAAEAGPKYEPMMTEELVPPAAKGLVLGDSSQRLSALYGPLRVVACNGYSAHVLEGRNATTVFYVLGDRLWAFGLSRPGTPLCR